MSKNQYSFPNKTRAQLELQGEGRDPSEVKAKPWRLTSHLLVREERSSQGHSGHAGFRETAYTHRHARLPDASRFLDRLLYSQRDCLWYQKAGACQCSVHIAC